MWCEASCDRRKFGVSVHGRECLGRRHERVCLACSLVCVYVQSHAAGYAKGKSMNKGKGKGEDGKSAGSSSLEQHMKDMEGGSGLLPI